MSLLAESKSTTDAPASGYETVREPVRSPSRERVTHAIERRASDGTLHAVVYTERKDREPSCKRFPLADIAEMIDTGVID